MVWSIVIIAIICVVGVFILIECFSVIYLIYLICLILILMMHFLIDWIPLIGWIIIPLMILLLMILLIKILLIKILLVMMLLVKILLVIDSIHEFGDDNFLKHLILLRRLRVIPKRFRSVLRWLQLAWGEWISWLWLWIGYQVMLLLLLLWWHWGIKVIKMVGFGLNREWPMIFVR